MKPIDNLRTQEAAAKAAQALARLDLNAKERKFAAQQAEELLRNWVTDPKRAKQMRDGRLRPRVIPAIFACALAAAESLYDHAMEQYPSAGA